MPWRFEASERSDVGKAGSKKLTTLGEVRSFFVALNACSRSSVHLYNVSFLRRALRGSVVVARSLTKFPS